MTGSAKRGINHPEAASNGASSRKVGHRSDPGLDRDVQAQIGLKLRAMYGELSEQPLPERLSAIIGRLSAPGRESGS